MIGYQRIARALHAGPWTATTLATRLAHQLGRLTPSPQARRLARTLVERWPVRPEPAELAPFLRLQPDITDEPASSPAPPEPPAPPRPRTRIALDRPLKVHTRGDLERLLWLTSGELDWFADRQLRLSRTPSGPLTHYRYRSLSTPGKVRLLEIPKPRLKEIQRRLLAHLIGAIPLHPTAHGAVPGRSVRTCVQPHAGRAVLVRCDLEGFFAGIHRSRVRGLLATAGLSDELAAIVAGLTTAAVPVTVRRGLPAATGAESVDARRRTLHRLAAPHLPQGAPTSPALANAVAFSLDVRLTALALELGARYTRYVDDLIFSGPAELPVGALLAGVRTIVADEDFRLAERKTAVRRSSGRQAVLGTVVNETPSIDRRELDRLRAILHNCARHGVASQAGASTVPQFRARLLGRLAWVGSVHPGKGARLRQAFDALDWPA